MGNNVGPCCSSCWNDPQIPALQTLVMHPTMDEAISQEVPGSSPWDETLSDGAQACAHCWNEAKGPVVQTLVDHPMLDEGFHRMVPGAAEWEQILAPGMLADILAPGKVYGGKDEPVSPSVSSSSGGRATYDKPAAFSSMVSTESTAPSTCSGTDQSRQAQLLVQDFTRSIVKGCRLSVLTTNGGAVDCFVSLNRELTTLFVRRSSRQGAKRRSIPLAQIERICAGEAAGDVGLNLDENCCTLICNSMEAIAFRFNDLEERDTFVLCISLFADRAKE